MKSFKIFFLFAIAIAIVVSLSSFIGYGTCGSAPGIIQFKGDDNVFTVEKWSFTTKTIELNDIENLKVEAEMNMTSIDCSWNDLLVNVKKKKDYFYVKKFPSATISIDKAAKLSGTTYTCEAMLTLKSVKKPVTLTFSVETEGGKSKIIGSGRIKRQDFDFNGNGPNDYVPVTFEFKI